MVHLYQLKFQLLNTLELSLQHLIRPSSGLPVKEAPVLFMFHGYGSDMSDLFSFAQELPEKYFVISVQAPYAMQPYGFAWYAINFDATNGKWSDHEQAEKSRDLIAGFIDEACNGYGLNTKKVNLMGFSQGSILSYAVALSYPDKAVNVIALSGYINTDIIKDNYTTADHSGLAVYASHGSADQVIPVAWARKTPEVLNALEIEHEYQEFPVGHGVAPQNFYSMLQWLNAHN